MIPLLVEGTMGNNLEAQYFQKTLAPPRAETCGGIGGLVVHLLRSASSSIEFQHKMFRILRNNEDIVHLV